MSSTLLVGHEGHVDDVKEEVSHSDNATTVEATTRQENHVSELGNDLAE